MDKLDILLEELANVKYAIDNIDDPWARNGGDISERPELVARKAELEKLIEVERLVDPQEDIWPAYSNDNVWPEYSSN
jgi:hypothetical protein